ncbi:MULTISPECIES: VOC family protein [unclassified Streptomyces]|uniref:VOC family protein n=1 Tax=unclassified Streptomyces TaxID=2593676 RepID=UPI0027E2EF5F|nr:MULTISPECIES: VOC family protein [unclassified Streptomyces]
MLVEPRDGGPRLWCQLVPEPKCGKNRPHLDLGCVDPETEIGRLTALGATVQARHEDHWVPADPEGNEFRLLPTPP